MSLLTSKTTSTSSTTRNVPGEVGGLDSTLQAALQKSLSDPMAAVAPLKAPSMEAINRNYAAAPGAIAAKMGARGYSSSGKAGGAFFGLEKARLGDLSNLEGTLDTAALNGQQNSMSLAERLIADRTGTTQTGTQTSNPGIGGLISSGLGMATTLFGLNALLKGGGSALGALSKSGDFGGEY